MTEETCEHLACGNVSCHGDELRVDLWYPRNEDELKAITIGLYDVRAADSIRVEYNFNRDGWVIFQKDKNNVWNEQAFLQAWALNETKEIEVDDE